MQSKTMISRFLAAGMLSAGVIACASSPSAKPREDRAQTITLESTQGAGTGMVVLRPDLSGVREPMELPANKVWSSLPAAYNALAIPLTGVDTLARSVSHSVAANRHFLRRPVSQFVDCGTSITGSNADSYTVRLNVRSSVDSLAASTSTVNSRVDATANTSGGTKRCSSSGALERLISDQVKQLLG